MIKLFISHASEDKNDFVRSLASEINKLFDVWYDEKDLKVGDSLLQAIQKGLVDSDYGIVVLSHSFFNKHWTTAELDGLFSLEIATGKKILPIWHNISFEEVVQYSPILAGRLAVNSSIGVENVAREIESVIMRDRAHHIQKPEYQIIRTGMKSTNEFIESDGSKMLHSHECKLTALVDGVSQYTEQLQADGTITNFNVTPGNITKCREEESIIYLDSEFDSVLNAGESIYRKVSCLYQDSFMNNSEYWVIRPSNPTQDIEIEFIFPRERPPTAWETMIRKLNYEEPSTYKAISKELADGRTSLTWKIPELGAQSSYKLMWEW